MHVLPKDEDEGRNDGKVDEVSHGIAEQQVGLTHAAYSGCSWYARSLVYSHGERLVCKGGTLHCSSHPKICCRRHTNLAMFHDIRVGLKNKGWGPTGSGPPPTDQLTPPTKDSLFLYQLQNADPRALNDESLLVAKICGKSIFPQTPPLLVEATRGQHQARHADQRGSETRQYANSIFRPLTKLGVIDASTGRPDTTKIDQSFVSKIAIISVPKQRELVDMLFWWEEELTRWRLLDEEQAEIEGALTSHDGGSQNDEAELQERLRVIEAKRRILPSLRRSDGTLKTTEERPPEYTTWSSTCSGSV